MSLINSITKKTESQKESKKDKIMKMDAGYDKMNIIFRIFCVYDEPSADLCLHKDLHLTNVHHRAVKRDDVQSIRIE